MFTLLATIFGGPWWLSDRMQAFGSSVFDSLDQKVSILTSSQRTTNYTYSWFCLSTWNLLINLTNPDLLFTGGNKLLAIFVTVNIKVPPCRQTHTGSSSLDHSNGPTSRHHPTTSPRSFPVFLRPADWTGSVCATESTKPASRHQKRNCPLIPGRWCQATRASSPGGRRTWRSPRGLLAPGGHGALPSGRHVPSTSWMHQRSPRSCCRRGSTCILSCNPSGNLRRQKTDMLCQTSAYQWWTTEVWSHISSCSPASPPPSLSPLLQ